jgi:CheY-like chemotaxis protein
VLSGKRVLIVDDNATNRQILQAYVQSWEMVARETASPTEALEWIGRGDPFDVAVLDMQMPDLDGLALASAIRRHRGADRLPLILLTSLGRRETGGDEFAAHLTKPIRPSQLYDTLLSVLGGTTAPRPGPEAGIALVTEGAPLQVLVAEDNPVNQRIALLLLQKLGHQAHVATNGVEALDALDQARYDAVLMDVQMPEMDGLEATRRIHERWPGSDRPRIIAVTAGAMSEERERCLAAGMDDYLSKPIRLEELSAALARVEPRDGKGILSAAIDPDAFARLRTTLGTDDAVTDLVDLFLTESANLMSTIRSAVRNSNADELRRAAHTLRSNAATFGAETLATISGELELMGEQHAVTDTSDLVSRLETAYEQVRAALQARDWEQVS